MDRTLLSRAVNFLKDQRYQGMGSINGEVLEARYGEDTLRDAVALVGMRLVRRAGTAWILTDATQRKFRDVGKDGDR